MENAMRIPVATTVLVVASVVLAPPCAWAQTARPEPAGAARAHDSVAVPRARSPQDVVVAKLKVRDEFLAGRVADAMAEAEKAIGIAQAARGEGHPEVAFLKVVLACFRESRGDFASARDLLREALEILERDTLQPGEMAVQVQTNLTQVEQLAALDETSRRRLMEWVDATALVVAREPIGSAFCVDRRGLFVTTADLVADLAPARTTEFIRKEARIVGTRVRPSVGEGPLALRLHTPGGLGPRLPARVIRVDRVHNFALLAVKPDKPMRQIELARQPPVPATRATALTQVLVNVDDTPYSRHRIPIRFTVPRTVRIETVRMRRGKCWLITLDETRDAGPSGPPVLDGEGRLVGVLFNGLPGTGVHYVLPAAVLAEFLGPAQIVLDSPLVAFRRRKEPVSLEVRVFRNQPLPAGATLDLLVGEGPAQRSFGARRTRDDTFETHVVPVPAEATDVVDLVATDANPPARWTVSDAEISVGATRLRLSDVRLLRPGETLAGYDVDGRPLFGRVSGLEEIRSVGVLPQGDAGPAKVGGLRVAFPPDDPAPVACEAILRDGTRVLDRVSFVLPFRDPPTDVLGSLDLAALAAGGAGRTSSRAAGGKGDARVQSARLAPGAGAANADAIRVIRALAFTRDGRYLVVGGNDSLVHVWDPATNQELQQMRGHTGAVVDLAVTPDGHRVLSASLDGTVRVWNLSDGKQVQVFRGHPAAARCVAVSPDGRIAASGGDGKGGFLRIWEIEKGNEIVALPGHGEHVFAVAFLPDGRRILSAGDDSKLRLWDLLTAREIRSFENHKGNVYCIAVSPDGSAAFSGGEDRALSLWDVESGRLIQNEAIKHTEPINRVAFLGDGPTVLTAGDDGQVGAWNLKQDQVKNHQWKTVQWKALAVSPDGRRVAFGGKGMVVTLMDIQNEGVMTPIAAFPMGGSTRKTDLDRTQKRASGPTSDGRPGSLQLAGALTDLALGGGGRYLLLAMGRRKELAIFDVKRANVVKTLPLASEEVLVAAGARQAVLVYPGLDFLHRIDLETLALDGRARIPVSGRVTAVAMGSDSAGPILAAWSPAYRRDPNAHHYFSLIDLGSLKVLDVRSARYSEGKPSTAAFDAWGGLAPIRGVIIPFELNGRKSLHLRASAGGDLFGLWDTNNSPDGLATLALGDNEARVFYEHSTSTHVVPGPDGRTVYTGALGRVDPDGKPLSRLGEWAKFPRMIPSTDPKFYLGVWLPMSDPNGPRVVLTFHEAGTDRVLGHLDERLDDFEAGAMPPNGPATDQRRMLDFDRRFLWVPEAELLVLIPPTDDHLILRNLALGALSGTTGEGKGAKHD
jgi:WD40 repeat protein